MGSIVGTLEYMAPEQFRGEEVDHRADLWATAVMAYVLLCGRVPFPGDTIGAVSVAVSKGEITLSSYDRHHRLTG